MKKIRKKSSKNLKFNTYILKILKMVHPSYRIARRSVQVIDQFLKDFL